MIALQSRTWLHCMISFFFFFEFVILFFFLWNKFSFLTLYSYIYSLIISATRLSVVNISEVYFLREYFLCARVIIIQNKQQREPLEHQVELIHMQVVYSLNIGLMQVECKLTNRYAKGSCNYR